MEISETMAEECSTMMEVSEEGGETFERHDIRMDPNPLLGFIDDIGETKGERNRKSVPLTSVQYVQVQPRPLLSEQKASHGSQ